MCVFGDAGCGKTYFLKQLIAFILKNTNDEIYIISSCADEYDAILKDGNRFDFDGSCGYFNPLDYYCSIDASYRYEVKVKDDFFIALCSYIMGGESLPRMNMQSYTTVLVMLSCLKNQVNIPLRLPSME